MIKCQSSTVQCNFRVPKIPTIDLLTVIYSGHSVHHCAEKLTEFKWSFAVFCPKSFLCGFGSASSSIPQFESLYGNRDADFGPLLDDCRALVDLYSTTCYDVENILEQMDLLTGSEGQKV